MCQNSYGFVPSSRPNIDKKNLRPKTLSSKRPTSQNQAWEHFQHQHGDSWQTAWDTSTHIPSRIWGKGIYAKHSTQNASVAEQTALDFIKTHVNLLAPGAKASDFKRGDNVLLNGLRTVGFYQMHEGKKVVGGQVSFRFKNDRLFVIASEALSNIKLKTASDALSQDALIKAAKAWASTHMLDATLGATLGETWVLPLWSDSKAATYRWANEVMITSKSPRQKVKLYIDSQSGEVLQAESMLRFADAQLNLEAPRRYPGSDYFDYPAMNNNIVVDGQPTTTDENGGLSWPGNNPSMLEVFLESELISVNNQSGAAASQIFDINPNEVLTWQADDNELLDAQLSGYVHTQIVKNFARNLNPGLAWIGRQQDVNVNISDSCNAFSDGDSINFLVSNNQCENTARLADVVYHEFGHSLHANSIIRGAGSFDGAFSEGLSDYLAATITGDPGMGRGFFKNNDPLRHIDPANQENRWPEDVGEVHFTGLIFGQAMWDLRKLLVETHGEEQGVALADKLYYGAVQRSSSIPTTYVEILAEDDDDGDLSNGTPNICNINASFGRHGLRPLQIELEGLDTSPPRTEGFEVSLTTQGLLNNCPGDRLAEANISWRFESEALADAKEVAMTENADRFVGNIPNASPGQTVRYKVELLYADGTSQIFPNNPADPEYQFYIGDVEEIFCTDFETDPFTEEAGWTHGLSRGTDVDGADDWMWGTPQGAPESGDPSVAFSGNGVVGNDLGGADFNGLYQADKTNWLRSPPINVADFSNVRLQYRRWLNVEDGFFDQGFISVNSEVVWQNLNSNNGNRSTTHHADSEWRFHDVPLSDAITEDEIQISFSIQSDGGLELGGWTIDDFCLVAGSGELCGDGEVNGNEECDDGTSNSDLTSGACRSDCTLPVCGDSVVDESEDCDDGNTENGDSCPMDCRDENNSAERFGCQQSSSSTWIGLFLAAFFFRRRKSDLHLGT